MLNKTQDVIALERSFLENYQVTVQNRGGRGDDDEDTKNSMLMDDSSTSSNRNSEAVKRGSEMS
jgi:hypothetical protein